MKYEKYESLVPNFGSSRQAEKQQEPEKVPIIEAEETVYDPAAYTEVSSEDILSE